MDAEEAREPQDAVHQAREAYYGHGTAAERWERAGLFFEAKEYASAARVLATLTAEVPEQLAPRLLLGAPTTTPPSSRAPRRSCGSSWSAGRWRTTRS